MKSDLGLLFPEALGLHLLLTGCLLALGGFLLHRRGLFHYLSAGFWAMATFGLYFFAAPLLNCLTGELFYLETRLAVTEGVPRLLWVTCCISVGLAAFFGGYLRTGRRQVTFGLREQPLTAGTWLILALALAAAAYALVKFRGSFATAGYQVVMESGKFTGDITGYHYVAHLLALFPLIWLICREDTRKLGFLLALVYLGARLEDGWNRQSVVALLLSLSMIMVAVKRRRWPRWPWCAAILLVVLGLTVRGHLGLRDYLATGVLDHRAATHPLARGGDTAMLATLILESYLADAGGYNFGLPTLNRAFFGMIPRKFFPGKDEALENFLALRPGSFEDIYGAEMMFGAKSTVIGDFYHWGGIFMVALGMAGLGFLCCRLDGLLAPACPTMVRAQGFLWLGSLWMLLAGSLFWVLASLFVTGLPFAFLAGWQKLVLAGQGSGNYRHRQGRRFPGPTRIPGPRPPDPHEPGGLPRESG